MDLGTLTKKTAKTIESTVTSPYTAGAVGATGVMANTFSSHINDTMPYSLTTNSLIDYLTFLPEAAANGLNHIGEKGYDSLTHLSDGNVIDAGKDILTGANVQNELYSRIFNADTIEQIGKVAEYTPYIAGGLLAYRAGKWGYDKIKEHVRQQKERKQHKKLTKDVSTIEDAFVDATSKAAVGYGATAAAAYESITHLQEKLEPLNYVDSAIGAGKTAFDIHTGGMGTVGSQLISGGRYMVNDGVEVSGGLFAASRWGDIAGDLTQKALYVIDKFPSEQLPTLGISGAVIGGLGLVAKLASNKRKNTSEKKTSHKKKKGLKKK